MSKATPSARRARDDQLRAATDEASQRLQRLAATIHLAEPDRFPRPTAERFAVTEERKRKVNAAITAAHPCWHILHEGPRPVVVWLALEIAVCVECDPLDKVPPSEHDDRCDWCHAHGHRRFTPVTIQAGPVLVIGDACSTCAQALGCRS